MYKVRSARASRRKLSGARFARVTAIGTHPNPAGSSVPASNEPVAGRHHIKANRLAKSTFWDSRLTRRRNNRTVESLKRYTEFGISHQEPCGKAVFGPLNRPSLMSLARKDGNTVLRFHTLCGSQGALLHAILVDGMIETIEGRPELADTAVRKQRKAGHLSEYLFAARSQQEFERKRNAIPLLQRQCASAH